MLPWMIAALAGLLAGLLVRRKVPIWRKVLFAGPFAAIAVVALFFAAGMRMEMEGGGLPKFVTFQNPEKQAAQIEADRAREAVAVPVPEPAKPAPAPVAEPSVVQAAVNAAWPDFRGSARDGVSSEKDPHRVAEREAA